MRTKLQNDYFANLANNINIASEQRKVEEEFRLCNDYHMLKHSNKLLISNKKLSEFFEDHFKDKPVELQPEVKNPENSHFTTSMNKQ